MAATKPQRGVVLSLSFSLKIISETRSDLNRSFLSQLIRHSQFHRWRSPPLFYFVVVFRDLAEFHIFCLLRSNYRSLVLISHLPHHRQCTCEHHINCHSNQLCAYSLSIVLFFLSVCVYPLFCQLGPSNSSSGLSFSF